MWRLIRGKECFVKDSEIIGWIQPVIDRRSTEIRVGNQMYDFASGRSRGAQEEYEIFDARNRAIGRAYSKKAAENLLLKRGM